MQKTVTLCDICGKEDAKRVYLTVDRRMDPAGSMDDVQESIDLCGDDARLLLAHICSHAGYTPEGFYAQAAKVHAEVYDRAERKARKERQR